MTEDTEQSTAVTGRDDMERGQLSSEDELLSAQAGESECVEAARSRITLPVRLLRMLEREGSAAPAKELIESYKYDPAGNILEKLEHGETTTMTYDAANQLVSSVASSNSQPAAFNFQYDKAGRLLSFCHPEPVEGSPTTSRQYRFLDKVLVLTKSDGTEVQFDYYPDGQLAAKSEPSTIKTEPSASYAWDGLALLYRDEDANTPGGTGFAVEPHVSGGVPIVATDTATGEKSWHINDILGTTLAVIHPDRVEIVPLTAFGKPRGAAPNSLAAATAPPPTLSPEPDAPPDVKNNSNIAERETK